MKLEFSLPPEKQPIPEHAQKVFTGEIFSVYQWEQELFDGTTAVFEKLKRADTVGVVPVTKDNKIIVTKQQQPGMKTFYSLAGGRIDPGEDVSEAAKRELREESGMVPTVLVPWFALRPIEKIDWTIYAVVARECEQVGELQLDGGEKIELLELTFSEFVKITRDPLFRDLEITALLYKAIAENSLDEIKELFFG